jgi:hypothetical protein
MERAPSIHFIGGWVGPRADLNNVEKFLGLARTQKLTNIGGLYYKGYSRKRLFESKLYSAGSTQDPMVGFCEHNLLV